MYVWTLPYVWMPCICLDAPIYLDTSHMFVCPLYVLMMFGSPLYIHNTRKACFVRLRGCPYAPIHFDGHICLDSPCMFGWSPYVWTPHKCLNAPYMFGYPHMFGHPHMFGCLLYIYNTKKACFVRLRGCPYAPYIWMPHFWMHPLYVWLPHTFGCSHMCGWLPVSLNAPHMFGYMF